MTPTYDSEDAYVAALAAPEPWLGMAAQADIKAGRMEYARTGYFPVVIVRPDHVVKLYSTWRAGHATMDAEVAALSILGRDRSLPAPGLVASGSLGGEWRFLVMTRVPGVAISWVHHQVDRDRRSQVVAWLGCFVHKMHELPLTADERADGWEEFIRVVTWRHAHASMIMANTKALPERLIDQIEGWIPDLSELLGSPADAVLVHGDLSDEHVMGSVTETGFSPSGVIDFNRASIGDPMFDFGPLWFSMLGGQHEPTRVFLQAAGIDGDGASFPRHALAWAMMRPNFRPVTLPGIDTIGSLDELAQRSFGRAA